jgi:hypothetical protein
VLTAKDRFVEQIEERFLALFNCILLTQSKTRNRNSFSANFGQLMTYFNTQLTQLVDVMIVLQLSHQSFYLF